MKLEDVLLTEKQIRLIVNNRGTWSSVRDDTMALITAEKAARVAQLKLLDVLGMIGIKGQAYGVPVIWINLEDWYELEKLLKE